MFGVKMFVPQNDSSVPCPTKKNSTRRAPKTNSESGAFFFDT